MTKDEEQRRIEQLQVVKGITEMLKQEKEGRNAPEVVIDYP
jgi:hypothetical protein